MPCVVIWRAGTGVLGPAGVGGGAGFTVGCLVVVGAPVAGGGVVVLVGPGTGGTDPATPGGRLAWVGAGPPADGARVPQAASTSSAHVPSSSPAVRLIVIPGCWTAAVGRSGHRAAGRGSRSSPCSA